MATVNYLGQNAQSSTSSPSLAGISVTPGQILVSAIFSFLVAPAPLLTACTHDGETLGADKVVGPVGVAPNTWAHIALRSRVVTDAATAAINVTLAGAATLTLIAAWSIDDGDTASPLGDTDTQVVSAGSNAITVDTSTGAAVISAIIVPDGWTDFALSPQSGTTADFRNDPTGTAASVEMAVGHRIAAGATTSVGWDFSYTKDSLHVAAVYNPASGGGGTTGPRDIFTGRKAGAFGSSIMRAPMAPAFRAKRHQIILPPGFRRAA